jgi:hypothetical protein
MEPESSFPYSQAPVTYPYPEPTPSSPHNPLPLPEDPYRYNKNKDYIQSLFYKFYRRYSRYMEVLVNSLFFFSKERINQKVMNGICNFVCPHALHLK